jgi:transaldolase
MKYFLDSAKFDEIVYAYEKLGIDGVTTNPRHVQMSGKPFVTVLKELATWVQENRLTGYEKFPISVEVNPHLTEAEDIMEAARSLAALSPNFVIKVPCTVGGLCASRLLEAQGVRTNVTLVFSASQAILPAKNGAHFVSPFIGWKESSGEDTAEYIREIAEIYKEQNYKSQIIVAAVRNGRQIAHAARVGAHIVTCGLDALLDSLAHPFTDKGLKIFQDSWDAIPKE